MAQAVAASRPKRPFYILATVILAAQLASTSVYAQYSNKAANVVGTAGGVCDSTLVDYAWPDINGYILKCVANVWRVVNIPAAAAGSTGYVQFNNGGALAGDSSFFWDNTNKRLGIGTTTPSCTLTISPGGGTPSATLTFSAVTLCQTLTSLGSTALRPRSYSICQR